MYLTYRSCLGDVYKVYPVCLWLFLVFVASSPKVTLNILVFKTLDGFFDKKNL